MSGMNCFFNVKHPTSMRREIAYTKKTGRALYLMPYRVSTTRPHKNGASKANMYNNDLRTGRRTYSFSVPLCKTKPQKGIFKAELYVSSQNGIEVYVKQPSGQE